MPIAATTTLPLQREVVPQDDAAWATHPGLLAVSDAHTMCASLQCQEIV